MGEPTLNWYLFLVPEILLTLLLFGIQIYSRLLPNDRQRNVGVMTAWGSFAILLATLALWRYGVPNIQATLPDSLIWGGMIRDDLATLVFRVIFIATLLLTSLISLDTPSLQKVEYSALLITATMGFNLMAASADLIMLYVGLEMASISSYVLAGFAKGDDRSAEAGIKYFVYGAFATAVMLFGMSLIYGLVGHTNIYVLGLLLQNMAAESSLLAAGLNVQDFTAVGLVATIMVLVGLGFKISAVPFHWWAPDTYHGAPTPFTAFVSTASKAAGFAVLIRIFTAGAFGVASALPAERPIWWPILIVICLITMTLGNLAAIYQTNIKRMLAYSSVAQAGYTLIGLVIFTQSGAGAAMFYLLMYVFTNVAAFGVVALVSNITKSDEMQDLYGLSRRSPNLALVMLVALLSLGGIPPTAGFLGKFYLFKAAIDAGYWQLALFAILNAFVALYYYLNVVKYMYLYPSDAEEVPIPVSRGAAIGLVIATLATLFLGVYSGPAYEWTLQAASAFLGTAVGG